MFSYMVDLIVLYCSLAVTFVSFSLWKMSVNFHKELRGAILGEWSCSSGDACQDATCSIYKEFRTEYVEG